MCDHTHPEIEELASVVMGPRKTDLEGGGRREEEGLAHKVDVLYVQATNGGMNVHIPWAKIGVAFIGGIASIIVAIIQSS